MCTSVDRNHAQQRKMSAFFLLPKDSKQTHHVIMNISVRVLLEYNKMALTNREYYCISC